MMKRFSFSLLALFVLCMVACGGPVEPAGPLDSGFVTEYLTPTRIVCASGAVENAEHLLKPYGRAGTCCWILGRRSRAESSWSAP